MTRSNEVISERLSKALNAVKGLDALGLKINDMQLGNARPRIQIERPPQHLAPKGAEAITPRCLGGDPQRILAAVYKGCLVEWSA
ncbi:hypothetical protein [Agarivorans sp. QJM3NY_25]|uniref:hypothetical protein n=1 Tax=Agarivorans sp. QJM3NY_25 TaxID=3421430 RepID=UPI003D7D7CF8